MAYHAEMAMLIILGAAILLIATPVSAAINTITAGSTVFIGEDGLDITAAVAGDTRIGWWASAASPATSSPDYTFPVSNPTDFYVSPADFGPYTGVWYRLDALGKSNGVAFTVVDPRLVLKIEDTTVDVDVTDKWVPTGDSLRFRIETNLIPIARRPGVTSVPITIKVQSPDGGVFTSLVNGAGMSTSLVDIPVTTTPFYTDSVWNTGLINTYPTGTYTIWAECNVNFMNDRYGEAGKTTTRQISLLDQDLNPLYHPRTTTETPTPALSPATTHPTTVTTPLTTPPATPSPTITTPASPTATTPPVAVSSTPPIPGFEGAVACASILLILVFRLRRE